MPFIRDSIWVYESVTTDAGITIPMPAYQENDLILVFAASDTGATTWGCSGFTQLYARANTVYTVCYYKIATSSESDVAVTGSKNETYNGCVITIGDVDTSYPFGNPAVYSEAGLTTGTRYNMPQITTDRDNCLIIYFMALAVVSAPTFIQGPVNYLIGGDGAAESMGVGWGFQKAQGSTASNVYSATYASAAGARAVIEIAAPATGALVIPSYVASDSCRLLNLIHGTTAWNGDTALAATADSNFGTSLGGKTANDATVAAAQDIGIMSFHAMGGLTNANTVGQISGAELVFAVGNRPNVGTKNILCHVRPTTPAHSQRFASVVSGRGFWFGMRSNTTGTSDHMIWQVHGSDAPWSPSEHVPIIINSAAANAKDTAGTLTTSAITAFGFWNSGISNLTCQMSVGMLWLMDVTVIAGGNAAYPMTIPDIAYICGAKGKERYSVKQQGVSQMLCLQQIQFGNGGTNPIYLKLENTAIEFPKQYDAASKVVNYNSTDNMVGITYYPGPNDTIIHRNSLVSSPSKYFWGLHSSATTSGVYDFSGLTLIGAGQITLISGVALDGLVFMGCDEVPAVGAVLTNCEFNATVGSGSLSVSSSAEMSSISSCIFSDNTYGIRLTSSSADTYSFDNIQFNNNTNDLYIGATTGTVTINVVGGDTPTYTSAGADVVVNNLKTLTLTGLVPDSEVRIYGSSQGGTTSGTLSSFSETLSLFGEGLGDMSFRQILPFSEAGESVRVKVKSPELGILKIDHASIGVQDTGINTVSTPVEIKWGGSSGVTLSGGTMGASSSSYSTTLDTQDSGWVGDSIRQIVTFSNGGTQVRVRVISSSSYGTDIDHMSIGEQDTGINTTETPTELKFGGSSGVSLDAGSSSEWSDWTDFPSSGSTAYVIIIDYASSNGGIAYTSGASVSRYYKDATATWDQASVTGFTGPGTYTYTFYSIEVRSVTGSAVESWSDWTTFNSVEGNQIIIFDMAATNSGIAYATGSSVDAYFKDETDSWNQSSVTGFTGPADYNYGISEVEVYYENTTTSGEIVELGGVENSSSSFQYLYNYTDNTYVDIVIHHLNYQYFRMDSYELPEADTSLPISQVVDRSYLNS